MVSGWSGGKYRRGSRHRPSPFRDVKQVRGRDERKNQNEEAGKWSGRARELSPEEDPFAKAGADISDPRFDMAYIASIHRPSGVRHALKLCLLDPEEECLVVAKSNRLEIYVQTPGGLVVRHSASVNGQVIMMEKIHPESSMTDQLFVVVDSNKYFTLSWDAGESRLRTEHEFVDVSDKNCRENSSYDRVFIDPRRRFLTLSLYEGIYTLLIAEYKQPGRGQPSVELGALANDVIPIRMGEHMLRSSTYLHYRTDNNKEEARIASLYEDNQQCAVLKVRTLQVPTNREHIGFDSSGKYLLRSRLPPTASHLIAVPNPINGMLILSETSLVWVDDTSERFQITGLQTATVWACWTQVDDKVDDSVDNRRWLLADDYGWLYFVMINYDRENEEVTGMTLDKLGQTARAACLVYLDGGYVYIGSHSGDSQLVRIIPQGLEVVQRFTNIGPILDFRVMDMGNRGGGEAQVNEFSSGQARIVTGSNAFSDGTLRSVRSGVGVEEIGVIELAPPGSGLARAPSDLFHVQAGADQGWDDLLLLTYVDETRVFSFAQDGSVEEKDNMITNEQTLLANKMSGSQPRILQCTTRSVTIYSANRGSLSLTASWQLSGRDNIVAASGSDQHVALSIGGQELVVLDVSEAGTKGGQIGEVGRRSFPQSISCVSIPHMAPSFLLVGFWQNTSMSVIALPSLSDVHHVPITANPSAVPRSILLTQLLPNQPPSLLVALGDGHVATWDVEKTSFQLSNPQMTILGSQPANLRELARDNQASSVFAIAEHSTLIYGAENRLVYSAVTAEDATCVCAFDSVAYPSAVALATPSALKIAVVDRERTTHVSTLRVGETVRRLGYSAKLRAFGMGTLKRQLEDGVEVVSSVFRLADEINFSVITEWALNKEEIVECVMCSEFYEDGEMVERFVVGTSYLGEESDIDSPRGRALVFEVTSDRQLALVTETKFKGACRCLSMLDGKIVTGLVKTVCIYAYEGSRLQKKASYRAATAPIDMYVEGNNVVVADLMKSVAVLQYTPGKNGEVDKLEEICRHFQICWTTSIAPVEKGLILESDTDGNLLVLRQNTQGATEDDQRRLEVISEINIGDMVNRMRPIGVPESPSAMVVPRAFVATVNGAIYMFGQIRSDLQHRMMELQTLVAEQVQTPGGIPWASWRAFRNSVRQESEPRRFVDGDLIEAFLYLPEETQQTIVAKLNTTVDRVKAMVETLQRMH